MPRSPLAFRRACSGRKSTPYVIRMLSSNLTEAFDRGESLEYAVRRTTMRSITEFVTADVQRWGYGALERGDYSGFLKMVRSASQWRIDLLLTWLRFRTSLGSSPTFSCVGGTPRRPEGTA